VVVVVVVAVARALASSGGDGGGLLACLMMLVRCCRRRSFVHLFSAQNREFNAGKETGTTSAMEGEKFHCTTPPTTIATSNNNGTQTS
jgi:hypothetical protein